MSASNLRTVGRRWAGAASACLLALLTAAPAVSQPPTTAPQAPAVAAQEFSEAWAAGDAARLRDRFAESVRLTLDTRSRTGVRPEQAVAALAPLLERFEGPAPVVVRAEPMGPDGESGFAELRWEARFRDSGTLRIHTFLLIFSRVGERLLVSDLRVVA